jgi:hypothetical protein
MGNGERRRPDNYENRKSTRKPSSSLLARLRLDVTAVRQVQGTSTNQVSSNDVMMVAGSPIAATVSNIQQRYER